MIALKQLSDAIIRGDSKQSIETTKAALSEGITAEKILNEGLIAGMDVVGHRFEKNEIYIPEMLIAARAMKFAMEILEPKLVESGIQPIGRAVIGTVQGDLHDIGKNLVGMMLKGAGFDVIDLGVDISKEKFVQAAKEKKAHILGMSALLTTTMTSMADVVKSCKEAGLQTKIMVGGAPLTQNFADKIGADAYAADASSAVRYARQLVSQN